ncbi:Ig-like domain-containing protein [Symmachiella dynata]|nr:Ig-like domain-containing protein [Symmachiella dynata]
MVCAVSLLLMTAHTAVCDDDKKPVNEKLERVTCRVRVVDALGNPVPGAIVMPVGFRALAQPKGYYEWVTERFGTQPKVKTGADGIAAIQIPKFAREQLEIGQVFWMVDDPDHVVYTQAHAIQDDPTEIRLKDGYRIAVTAIGAQTNEPIKQHLFAVQSGLPASLDPEWRMSKSGVLLSRVFDAAQVSLRLVALPPERPAMFSELITLDRAEDGGRVFLRNVPLKVGTRVQGKLDPAVPRPVIGGRVSAFITAGEPPNPHDRQKLWFWFDQTEIKPDGSFEFVSLPPGDIVQLVAMCDGWLSKSPTTDEIDAIVPWKQKERPDKNQVMPQVFSLNKPTIHPTIEMSKSATCKVMIVDPAGNRLANAKVTIVILRRLLRTGGVNLSYGYRSTDMLRTLRQGKDWNWESVWSRNDFQAKTDSDGIAVLRNLPGSRSIGLTATHAHFEYTTEEGRHFTKLELKPGETTEITIRMEPKGENELGAP